MTRAALAILVGLALTSSAAAGPAKVLVLPLDGDADPELRARYSASVQRLARTLDGTVAAGDVTFTDTATAIGCDPKRPACAEDVRATLGVDELVYGTVSKEGRKLVLVVRRTGKGKPRREISATVSASDSPDLVEPALLPLFREAAGPSSPGGPPVADPPPEEQPLPPPPPRTPRSRKRVLGYAAVGGGATLLLISFALWSSASGLKDDIEGHAVDDRFDFTQLVEIEDAARARAWAGNALFVAGLAAGGLGGWILYQDRKARHATIAPAPVPGGAALVLGGAF